MGKRLRTSMADKVKVKRTSTTTKRKRLGVGEKVKLEQKTRSGLEDKALKILDRNGVTYEYEPVSGKLDYIQPLKSRKYTPDVVIGNTIYEIKGLFSVQDRDKMKWVRDSNPEWEYVMVFQRNNPIRKGSKTRYSDWCEKNGFKYMMITEFEQYIKQRYIK